MQNLPGALRFPLPISAERARIDPAVTQSRRRAQSVAVTPSTSLGPRIVTSRLQVLDFSPHSILRMTVSAIVGKLSPSTVVPLVELMATEGAWILVCRGSAVHSNSFSEGVWQYGIEYARAGQPSGRPFKAISACEPRSTAA